MREKMPLTVIYGNLQVCGECFSIFDRYLAEEQYSPLGSPHLAKNRLFAQFHANYPEKEKNDILDDLLKGPGSLFLLTAAEGESYCSTLDLLFQTVTERSSCTRAATTALCPVTVMIAKKKKKGN